MTVTPNYGLPFMDASSAQKSLDFNEAIAVIDALLPRAVEDSTLTAPPVDPDEGSVWAVPATSTAAWLGKGGSLALFIGGGWLFYTAPPGVPYRDKANTINIESDGTDWLELVVAGVGGIYDLGLSFAGTPIASEVMGRLSIPRLVVMSADLAGSVGHVGVNPAAPFAIDVQDDGASIGTITISTAGVFTFTSAGGAAVNIAAGSLVTFHAPASADASIVDISATLFGVV